MLTDLIKVEDSDTTIVEQKVSQFLKEAQAVEITDDDDYQYAGELLASEKTIYKFVEKTYEKTKKSLNEAKAGLMKIIRAHTDPLDQAEGILKSKRRIWNAEQERIRLEILRKHEARLRKEEEERRLNEAVETGDESILEEPIIIAPPQVQERPKEKGHSFRDDWKCKVDTPLIVPHEYWIIDVKKIESVVRATKGTLQIPGVRIWKEQIESVRSR